MSAGSSFITIRVKLMGDLAGLLGPREQELALPRGHTVGDLLQRLSQHYGEPFSKRVFNASGGLSNTVVIFVNEEEIERFDGLARQLSDSQVEVVMLPVFEGG